MSVPKSNRPSALKLGEQLREIREKKQESIDEVSGAVEIETESLLSIEQGKDLPSEDILLLLISHFNLHKDKAIKLWELAGYDHKSNDQFQPVQNDDANQPPSLVVLPIDNRIIYTDLVNVSVNNYGVVMNFLQTSRNKTTQPVSVARVGMSREHAESVIAVLKKVLQTDQKILGSTKKTHTNKKKKEDR